MVDSIQSGYNEALERKLVRFGPQYSACFPTKPHVRTSQSVKNVGTPMHSVHLINSPFSVPYTKSICSLFLAQ